MHAFPEPDPIADASELTGHLWIQELPTGGRLRFRVADSGLVTLGTRTDTFEQGGDVPLAARAASRYFAEALDTAAVRTALDDPTAVTFFGIATRFEGIAYDWDRLPPFLGVDVWSANRAGFLPPDTATAAFERLGLSSLPAVETEVAAAYADLDGYAEATELPASAWADGPAAGVLVRDKTGGRARAWQPPTDRPDPLDRSAAALADRFATADRLARIHRDMQTPAPSVEDVLDRVLAAIAREAYAHLFRDDRLVVDERAFRSAVAERVRRHLAE